MNDNIKKPPATRVVLRIIRLAYADQVIVPKAFEAGQQEKYSLTILLPPDHPGIALIEAALEAAAIARWGKKADWPKRIRATEPPGIVDARVEEIAKADLRSEVYSGRWADVSANGFAYDRQTSKGVSLGLGNIRLLKHDTRLGAARPKPGDEFDPEDLPEADNDDFEPDTARPQRRR